MKSVGRDEMNIATIVTYALTMGLLERFTARERQEVIKSAIGHLPPLPNHHDDPVGLATGEEARKRLEALMQ